MQVDMNTLFQIIGQQQVELAMLRQQIADLQAQIQQASEKEPQQK